MPATPTTSSEASCAPSEPSPMVGASGNEMRPSYFAMKYLLAKGFVIHPINPGAWRARRFWAMEGLLPRLKDVPGPVDMVDNLPRQRRGTGHCRRSAGRKRIASASKVIWMQLGVINEEAAGRAAAVPASPSSWIAGTQDRVRASFSGRNRSLVGVNRKLIDNRKSALFGKGGSPQAPDGNPRGPNKAD